MLFSFPILCFFLDFPCVKEMDEIKNNLMKKQGKVRKRGWAPYSQLHEFGEPRYDFASAISAKEKVSCHQSSKELVIEKRRAPCVKLSVIEDENDMTQADSQVCLVLYFFSCGDAFRMNWSAASIKNCGGLQSYYRLNFIGWIVMASLWINLQIINKLSFLNNFIVCDKSHRVRFTIRETEILISLPAFVSVFLYFFVSNVHIK